MCIELGQPIHFEWAAKKHKQIKHCWQHFFFNMAHHNAQMVHTDVLQYAAQVHCSTCLYELQCHSKWMTPQCTLFYVLRQCLHFQGHCQRTNVSMFLSSATFLYVEEYKAYQHQTSFQLWSNRMVQVFFCSKPSVARNYLGTSDLRPPSCERLHAYTRFRQQE